MSKPKKKKKTQNEKGPMVAHSGIVIGKNGRLVHLSLDLGSLFLARISYYF